MALLQYVRIVKGPAFLCSSWLCARAGIGLREISGVQKHGVSNLERVNPTVLLFLYRLPDLGGLDVVAALLGNEVEMLHERRGGRRLQECGWGCKGEV